MMEVKPPPFRVCQCGEQYRPPLYAEAAEDYRLCDSCRAKAMVRRDRESAPYKNPYPSAIIGSGTTIRFGCYIMIPKEYRFSLASQFDKDPTEFLHDLIEGAVSNICQAPYRHPHDDSEWSKIRPKVIIRYVPNKL